VIHYLTRSGPPSWADLMAPGSAVCF